MLEGSDAKTETVRGLLLPSPMTVRARGWGARPSPTVGTGERRRGSDEDGDARAG